MARAVGMKLPRWRPVCPECGYSLRGLTSDRCPECGEPFPTTQRTFRRWALRRIPWDRRHRSSLVRAYFATVFLIVFCPWKAARGLVIPDRWGRAVRWAMGHTFIAGVLASFLGGRHVGAHWIGRLLDSQAKIWNPELLVVPVERSLTWAAQGIFAWWLVFLLPPLMGIALRYAVPVRHPAVRWSGVKWALYSTAVLPAGVAIWSALVLVSNAGKSYADLFLNDLSSFPHLPPAAYAGVYIACFATGIAVSPFGNLRGTRVFLRWAVGLALVWVLLTRVLFPTFALEDLL